MLTETEMNIFLDSEVNIKTFPIYAALSNLKNADIFKKTIELLKERKINYVDIANLEMIDEIAIQKLIDDVEKYLLPSYDGYTNMAYTSLYPKLMLDNTPLRELFINYNTYMNELYLKLTEKNEVSIEIFSIVGDTTNYYNDTNFTTIFTNKIISKMTTVDAEKNLLFAYNKLVNVPDILYAATNVCATIFLSCFNSNVDFVKSHVELHQSPSLVSMFYKMYLDAANIERFSKNSQFFLADDLNLLSKRESLSYTQTEINTMWTNLTIESANLDYINQLSISLEYLYYKATLINTLESINKFTVTPIKYHFLNLYDFIKEYIDYHKKIDMLIISELNVKIF